MTPEMMKPYAIPNPHRDVPLSELLSLADGDTRFFGVLRRADPMDRREVVTIGFALRGFPAEAVAFLYDNEMRRVDEWPGVLLDKIDAAVGSKRCELVAVA